MHNSGHFIMFLLVYKYLSISVLTINSLTYKIKTIVLSIFKILNYKLKYYLQTQVTHYYIDHLQI